MRHQLQREWWRGLMLVGGGIWSLSLIPGVLWAQYALLYQSFAVRESALVAVTLVVTLGWVVVPLLISGLDDTLDPARFASLGVQVRAIMPGLTVATVLTIPALFFLLVFGILASSWRSEGNAALVVALVGAVLTVLMMVFSARLTTAWAGRLLASRRARFVAVAAIGVGLALLSPTAWLLFRDGFEVVLEYDVPDLLKQAGRTPLGAGVAAAGAATTGHWWGVAWRLAMLTGWVVLLHAAWRANVAYALVNPTYRGGGTRQRHDTMLAAAERPRKLPERWQLSAPARAVRTRLSRYWATDPRYLASMVGVLAFPLMFFVFVVPVLQLDARWALVTPVLLAASIGWGRHNDVALDSTALWLDVTAGASGADLMKGRLFAVLTWALPAVMAPAVALVAWSGLWTLAPAVIGACVGVLGLTLGISAVSSVLLPYRAPAPGDNPFGAEVGSVGASLLAQLVSSFATAIAMPLVTVPFVLALTVGASWGWLALVTGLLFGILGVAWGVRLSGRAYNARAGSLVGAVS
jgi:ABC-2 type transport system permease protein